MDGELSAEELEALFNDETDGEGISMNGSEPNQQVEKSTVDQTKAFSKRLNDMTAKAIETERATIAKQLGFESYEEMLKKQEAKLFEDKGLNPEEVSPIVDELVKKRLAEDPRMKELEGYKAKQVEEYAKRELEEISKLTDGEITQLEQLPKNVVELWKKTGSLKSAYIQLEGEGLIAKVKNSKLRGETNHLQSPTNQPIVSGSERPLTAEEKNAWKFFIPGISDDDLNKKTVKLKT